MTAHIERIRRLLAGLPWFVRWGAGAALVLAILLALDITAISEQLRNVDWALALPAILALVLLHVIGAFTWQYLVERTAGIAMPSWLTIRAYYVGQALGGLTPGNLGSDAYRARLLAASGERWSGAVTPVVLQRFGSSAALAGIAAAASLSLPVSGALRLVLFGIALAAALVFAGVWWVRSHRGQDTILRGGANLARVTAAAVLFGAFFHAGAIVFTFVLLRAVTGEGDAAGVLAALAIARGATLLPFTPNGLGLQEAAVASLLPAVGVPAEAAVAAAALGRLAMFATMGLGAALWAIQRLPQHAPAASPALDQP